MPVYECIVVVKQSVGQDGIDPVVQKVKYIISSYGAKVLKSEDMGLINFAYVVRKKKRGHYVVLNIEAQDSDVITVLDSKLRLDDEVLRFMAIRIDDDSISPQTAM